MSEALDPYEKLLQLRLHSRLPEDWELLGIAPTESDPQRIHEAFNRRLAQLKPYEVGAYAESAQRLIDELSQAFTRRTDSSRGLSQPGPDADQKGTLADDRSAVAPPAGAATERRRVRPETPKPAEREATPKASLDDVLADFEDLSAVQRPEGDEPVREQVSVTLGPSAWRPPPQATAGKAPFIQLLLRPVRLADETLGRWAGAGHPGRHNALRCAAAILVLSLPALTWLGLAAGWGGAMGRLGASEPPTFVNSVGMRFVLIPHGEFDMGARQGEGEAYQDELPQHRVRLSADFWVGQHEVTQAQYSAVRGENPSHFSPSGAGARRVAGQDTKNFPVDNVSWIDGVLFANALSERENRRAYYRITYVTIRDVPQIAKVEPVGGNGYRLLTEAEWEYAARAGKKTIFPWGDAASSEQANFDGTRPCRDKNKGVNLARTTAAGSYPGNRWGVFDMVGNVCEWVWDGYDDRYYRQFAEPDAKKTAVDPAGPPRGSNRLFRGGSWRDGGAECRPAARRCELPDNRSPHLGLRLALDRAGT